MSKSFSLEQLTEGIRARHLGTQNRRLVEKWARTGLLRGLDGVHRENMACMLENQAAQVLKEASTLGSTTGGALGSTGHVRGFSNVAFPIVRRVFGGLIANDLVSIQPMSLPSGLLFYLDYTYGDETTGVATKEDSLYNDPAGKDVQSGSTASGGQYDLAGASYSRRRKELEISGAAATLATDGTLRPTQGAAGAGASLGTSGADGRLLQFDPEISKQIDDGAKYCAVFIPLRSTLQNVDVLDVKSFAVVGTSGGTMVALPDGTQSGDAFNVRRLNEIGLLSGGVFTANPFASRGASATVHAEQLCLKVIVKQSTVDTAPISDVATDTLRLEGSIAAALDVDDAQGDTLVIPAFEGNTEGGAPSIPEIDIKIEALAVTAQSRKLKAKWSPELAQDLNAYHSLDAEVELTQILSEQIALEIDREILNDLLIQGNGANLFWSRMPGKFVNKETGAEVSSTSSLTPGPAFTGTVREWYETLTETIIDAANTIHRKTLRGSANFIVVGPDVATILESSVMYRPSYSLDGDGQVGSPMTIGADKVGTLSNRFTVYKDPYFPRNKILVGYKGGSYLETGYVYAPYVPLIVTPTIFQPEDFTPRKGVMTRYGKKMVRSDFYGTVTVLDLNVI